MTAVCLLDTSIFIEILNVPNKAQQHEAILAQLADRLGFKETLFLPMATILETGNHIGQNGNGGARRACAKQFVDQVGQALKGGSPFKPISFLTAKEMASWLTEFTEHAKTGSGLGDLSIIHDWKRLCSLHRGQRVYIWSLDAHLAAFDRPPEL